MLSVEVIAAQIVKFANDAATQTLIVAIFIDLVTGIMAAVRTKTYDWGRIGEFYYTNVLPYVIGFAALYILTGLGLTAYLPAAIVGNVQSFTGTPAVIALGASIRNNVDRMQRVPMPPHEGDPSDNNSGDAPRG